MAVTKTVLKEGSGAIPKVGDTVTIEYTGYLKDTSKPDNKGAKYVCQPNCPLSSPPNHWSITIHPLCVCPTALLNELAKLHNDTERLTIVLTRFDSSVGRGAFVTRIGVGQVIKGIPSS